MVNAPPSMNQADRGSFLGTMRFMYQKFLQNTDDMLPAKVLSYDRDTNRATVQPLIEMVTTANERVARAQIASVPVLQIGAGGFVISFPVESGDIGWIKANDRDISNFKRSLNQTIPNTQRKHTFEDGIFIPDTMMQDVQIAEADSQAMVIQNLAGTVKISLRDNNMEILAPNGVGIGGTANASTQLHVIGTTKASIPWPRMTTVQRDAISGPIEGMVIWNLDTHGTSVYNGTTWS